MGGYAGTSGSQPPPVPSPFDNVNGAPWLQVFGNAVIGEDGGSNGSFALAGDGSNFRKILSPHQRQSVGHGVRRQSYRRLGRAGRFTQTDNTTVYLDGSLAVGLDASGTGQYTLTAGDSTTGGGSLSVGTDLTIGGLNATG